MSAAMPMLSEMFSFCARSRSHKRLDEVLVLVGLAVSMLAGDVAHAQVPGEAWGPYNATFLLDGPGLMKRLEGPGSAAVLAGSGTWTLAFWFRAATGEWWIVGRHWRSGGGRRTLHRARKRTALIVAGYRTAARHDCRHCFSWLWRLALRGGRGGQREAHALRRWQAGSFRGAGAGNRRRPPGDGTARHDEHREALRRKTRRL